MVELPRFCEAEPRPATARNYGWLHFRWVNHWCCDHHRSRNVYLFLALSILCQSRPRQARPTIECRDVLRSQLEKLKPDWRQRRGGLAHLGRPFHQVIGRRLSPRGPCEETARYFPPRLSTGPSLFQRQAAKMAMTRPTEHRHMVYLAHGQDVGTWPDTHGATPLEGRFCDRLFGFCGVPSQTVLSSSRRTILSVVQ
jgi:hypothetical protein